MHVPNQVEHQVGLFYCSIFIPALIHTRRVRSGEAGGLKPPKNKLGGGGLAPSDAHTSPPHLCKVHPPCSHTGHKGKGRLFIRIGGGAGAGGVALWGPSPRQCHLPSPRLLPNLESLCPWSTRYASRPHIKYQKLKVIYITGSRQVSRCCYWHLLRFFVY